MNKKHYVYEIVYRNNMKYIGVRTCQCAVEDDTYMGSSKIIPKEISKTGCKTIVKILNTREEAVALEMELHIKNNVALSSEYYNQTIQTSTKFDQSGCTAKTHPHIAAAAKKLSGRTAKSHQYIEKANIKRRLLTGKNRTKAQIAGSKIQAESIRGIKNAAKGHPKTSSSSFVPWYFIDSEGTKTIVTSITKKDFANKLGLTQRQLIYRFQAANEHKPLLTVKSKNSIIHGWTFGNMTNPPQQQGKRDEANDFI